MPMGGGRGTQGGELIPWDWSQGLFPMGLD
jgi:hypothetical protein